VIVARNAETSSKRQRLAVAVTVALFVEALLVIVGVAIVRGPRSALATAVDAGPAEADAQRIAEVLVLSARLPNNRSGATYLYETEIYVQVRRKHLPRITVELEQFHNEIRAELAAIWRTSEPQHFREPRLESLTRKTNALLGERFGFDPLTGERLVKKTVVVMGTGYRVEA
jgi:hypothetical protein